MHTLISTAIGSRKYRIPSDLRSQAGYRLVSTMVGDHMGILGVVVFDFCSCIYLWGQGEGRSTSPSPLKYGLGDISIVKQRGGESTIVGGGGGGVGGGVCREGGIE